MTGTIQISFLLIHLSNIPYAIWSKKEKKDNCYCTHTYAAFIHTLKKNSFALSLITKRTDREADKR